MAAVWRLPVVFFCENNQAEDIPLLPQSTSPEQHPPAVRRAPPCAWRAAGGSVHRHHGRHGVGRDGQGAASRTGLRGRAANGPQASLAQKHGRQWLEERWARGAGSPPCELSAGVVEGPRPASLVVVHSPLSTSPLRPPSPPFCCSWLCRARYSGSHSLFRRLCVDGSDVARRSRGGRCRTSLPPSHLSAFTGRRPRGGRLLHRRGARGQGAERRRGAHTLRTRRPRSRCGYVAPHNNRPCHDQALTFRHGSHNVGQNLPESTLSDDDREIRRKERLQMRQETSTRD